MEKQLNERQQQAVCHELGPMLVLAGPGSGKTTVLLCRILRLLERGLAMPQEILTLTFSKAAAEELKERFAAANGPKSVSFGTFHSIFFRILRRQYGWDVERVLQEEERRNILRNCISQRHLEIADIDEYITLFFAQLSLMNSELESLSQFQPKDIPTEEFQQLYREYQGYKERHEKIDFDDMLVECYHLLKEDPEARMYWQRRYRFFLVDEFQDINQAQFACLQLLAEPHQNLFVVGDDDQSIYAFRGARPEFLLQFQSIYPNAAQVILNINYRSTNRIIRLAERVIGNNTARFAKEMQGVGTEGQKVGVIRKQTMCEEAEAIADKILTLSEQGIPLQEIAVIYRTNFQGGAFARALYQRGIPYDLRESGLNIYEHWITKDLLAYLLLAETEESNASLRRILNKPKRYISKEILIEAEQMPYTLLRSLFVCPSLQTWQAERLETLRVDLRHICNKSPYEALRYIRKVVGYDDYLTEYAAYRRTGVEQFLEIAEEITEMAKQCEDVVAFRKQTEEMSQQLKEQQKQRGKNRTGVALLTMHGAKGLEFTVVFLPTLVEGNVPHKKAMEQIEEERRLFYVAVTRAKERLFLSAVRERYDEETKPSRFLAEMGLNTTAFFEKTLPKSAK